jgi:hypothetical protein
MRAPDKKPRSLDRIVEDLVQELDTEDEDHLSTEVSVRATIEYLRALNQSSVRGNASKNDKTFKTLRRRIVDLQRDLSNSPGEVLFLLVSGEDDVASDTVPATEVQKKVLRRLAQIRLWLDYLRKRCDFLLEQRPGVHGNEKSRQLHVAREGWRLLWQKGEAPKSSAPTGRFCRTASLLWEAAPGETDKDLEWACKTTVLREKRGDLHFDGIVSDGGHIREYGEEKVGGKPH